MKVWLAVAVVGVGTVCFKAAGPAVLGTRRLPVRANDVVALLAPTLLAALVVTQAVGGADGLEVDARIVGVGAAAIAIALRAPLLVVVIVAALTTAVARSLG